MKKNQLIIKGLCGEESNDVVGAFTQKIDLTSQKLVSGDSHLFSKEFMKEYWSGTSGMFEDSESNTISITNDYEFRTFIPTKDGYVALIEQAYIHCINGANGPICNDYTHGVIAYLVKTDGNIGWTTFIYKENKGKGTFGVSCSFGYLHNDEKIAVFFHDALDSYDTDGSYNNYRLPSKFSTKEYAFAQANIDISSGAITRHLAANAKELGGYPLPKYIARTKNPNEAVFVVITDFLFSKKRYGTLKI